MAASQKREARLSFREVSPELRAAVEVDFPEEVAKGRRCLGVMFGPAGEVLADGHQTTGPRTTDQETKAESRKQTVEIPAEGPAEILREMRLQRELLIGLQTQMEAVARGNAELRAAKERLAEMQGENLFKFVQRIDDRAFRIVCAVLVHGDVAKAARALSVRDSTLRQVMATWKKRGGPYLGLLELVRWRKRKRITGTVPFNDALLYDQRAKTSRESLLAEVLDGVLSMTEANWQDVCAELETMLREHVGMG